MALKLGYLLPTREQIMDGRPEAAPLLSLAERAERLGYDSIWVLTQACTQTVHLFCGSNSQTANTG